MYTPDELDLRILEQLQTDNTLSNQALAHKVHTSPPTCLRRVERLIREGFIERQAAVLNPARVGYGLTAIVEITLAQQGAQAWQAFEDSVANAPEIQQCYRVSAGPDFVLIIRVSDMQAYHALAHRLFNSQSTIRNIRTFFSVHCSKFSTRIPLTALKPRSETP